MGAGRDDLFLVRLFAAVRFAVTYLERRGSAGSRCVQRRARRRRRALSLRLVEARRRPALRREPSVLARTTAGCSSRFARSPIPRRICCCCNRGRSIGTCSHPRSSPWSAAIHLLSSPYRPRSSPACLQHRAPPLDDVRVRRAIAMSIDRNGISRKITLGFYPVTNMIQPHFSWAFDPSVRQPGYDPGGADRAPRPRRLAPRSRRRAPRNGVALRLVYVQFPETATGVRVATSVQASLRERGVDVTIKSVSNAQLFLPRTGVLAVGDFDLAYVPWTMGADPDDSSVLGCGGASNYMRWCDLRSIASNGRRSRADRETRANGFTARSERIVAREVPVSTCLTPIIFTRIASAYTVSRRTHSYRRGTPPIGARLGRNSVA